MTTRAYRAGCFSTDTPSDIIALSGAGAGAGHYSTLNRALGSGALASYQVTAGKTFYVTKIIFTPTTSTADVNLGYGDNAVTDSASAPTNGLTQIPNGVIAGTTANQKVEYDIHVPLAPSGKYPYYKNDGATGAMLVFGYEA